MNRTLFLLTLIVLFLEGARADDGPREPVVTLAPAQVTLVGAVAGKPKGWQMMTFTIFNRTDRKWQFSNFYESWRPLLLSENGEPLAFLSSRDATRPPRREDYPFLAPGKSASNGDDLRLFATKDGLELAFSDQTGGDFSAKVVPGHYKLCISYQADTTYPLFPKAPSSFRLDPKEIWPGWTMSNWVDLVIKEK